MTKKGLPLEQPREFGIELQAMRNRLVGIAVQIANAYPARFRPTTGQSTASPRWFS